jgi:hypothetical protein
MSRLDYHVTKVQGKLLLTDLLRALAWALLAYGVVVWLVVLAWKLTQFRLPREWVWFWTGLGVSVGAAVGYAVWRRPTRQRAAVAIDEKLGLKEKFSTALYARPSTDPFAAAAVRDAEATAEKVHLQDKFPIHFPRMGLFTAGVGLLAFMTGWLLQPMDLLGREQARAKAAEQQAKEVAVKQELKKALATIEAAPPEVLKQQGIQIAQGEIRKMLNGPIKDPAAAARKASEALENVKAQSQKIKEINNTVQAFNQLREWKQLAKQPIDESGPVGKAHSEMAKGNFAEAVEKLGETVRKFDEMEQKDKEKAAEQMAAMAQQIQQMANDPEKQQQMQQQLQNLGANKQQAQQMANAMQQAANGDKQAQQQLQQMANQLMQQMNNGQGPNAQQQQQVRQMMQQLQQQANGQAMAQQLAQNAQAMAQAMQNAAQAGQQQNGQQQGNQGNQGQPQQQAAGGKQGQQPGNQQQQGGPQQQQANQGAKQAQQQMQQQLAQMQAQAQAAAAAAAAQQGGNQPGQDGNQPAGAQPGGQDGQQAGGGENAEFQPGDNPDGQNQGPAGGGAEAQAMGERPRPEAAPFGTKAELSKSETIEKGKILAATQVKATALPGESKAQLQEAIAPLEAEATDEVDQTRVSKQARQAVKEYHRSMAEDLAKK